MLQLRFLPLQFFVVQEIVSKEQSKITLPGSAAGVTIMWTSNKSDIIDSEGNVTHKDGTEFDEVELTAKITKGEASAEKTFTPKFELLTRNEEFLSTS